MTPKRRAEIEALVDTSPNQVGWLREAARELLAEVDRLEGEVIAAESVMEIERGAAHKAEAQIAAAPDLYDFAAAHDAYMSEKFPDGPECGSLHPDARANWLRCRAALNRAERG